MSWANSLPVGIIGAFHTAKNANNPTFDNVEVKSSNLKVESSTSLPEVLQAFYNTSATADGSNVTDSALLYRLAKGLTGKTDSAVITEIAVESVDGGKKQNSTINNGNLNFKANAMPLNQNLVKAQAFAGGLFGSIPEGFVATIDCGAGADNTNKIQTTVQTTTQLSQTTGGLDDSVSGLTYAGGIIGRIPLE